MNIDYYQEGKNCALRGGSYSDNPFMAKDAPQNQGIIWLRGFKDGKTPAPNCTRCKGKGKIPTYVERLLSLIVCVIYQSRIDDCLDVGWVRRVNLLKVDNIQIYSL